MTSEKRTSRKGFQGEETAAKFLREKGLKVLERNYRCPLGELDIIAREGQTIVFIEVKSRCSDRFGLPIEGVDERKCRRLSRLALYYLKEKGWEGCKARFDVIGIMMGNEGKVEIDWVRDAFDFRS
ncbi:MAG: YraN family protein [Syntrophales bacterium]|nr:YraN family protein [Syntrophales bacterium]